jgi:hypothetical protein
LGGLPNEDELQKTTEPLFFKHPVVESFIFVICTSMSFKELLICVIGFQVLNYFTLCLGYPTYVFDSSYIGIIYFFGLIQGVISGFLTLFIFSFVVKFGLKKPLIQLISLLVLMLIVNQISFLFIGGSIPLVEWCFPNGQYTEGESFFFVLSSLLSIIPFLGFLLIKLYVLPMGYILNRDK